MEQLIAVVGYIFLTMSALYGLDNNPSFAIFFFVLAVLCWAIK